MGESESRNCADNGVQRLCTHARHWCHVPDAEDPTAHEWPGTVQRQEVRVACLLVGVKELPTSACMRACINHQLRAEGGVHTCVKMYGCFLPAVWGGGTNWMPEALCGVPMSDESFIHRIPDFAAIRRCWLTRQMSSNLGLLPISRALVELFTRTDWKQASPFPRLRLGGLSGAHRVRTLRRSHSRRVRARALRTAGSSPAGCAGASPARGSWARAREPPT